MTEIVRESVLTLLYYIKQGKFLVQVKECGNSFHTFLISTL